MAKTRIYDAEMDIGTATVGNEQIKQDDPIAVNKLQQFNTDKTNFDLASSSPPVVRTELAFVAQSAGKVRAFRAMLNDTGTTSSTTFDLLKNGSSVLSSTITITNAHSDRQVVDAVVNPANEDYADGDVFEFAITATSGDPAGPYCQVEHEFITP